MIPKIIHYCWFGKNPLPEDAIKCINSWKKYCPDYEIIQWNEDNYDVRKNKYMSDAYDEKKWAFVSDYARIDVVYENGGIYLDTDVELIKPIDKFLNDKLFCGWEGREGEQEEYMKNWVAFGLGYGAEKKSPILKDILDLYENLSFINDDGTLNLVPCPYYQTETLKKYGLDDSKRKYQKTNTFVVYPEDVFSPKSTLTEKINLTENTVSIHHFTASWCDKKMGNYNRLKRKLAKKIGKKNAHRIVWVLSAPYKIRRKIREKVKALKRKRKRQV